MDGTLQIIRQLQGCEFRRRGVGIGGAAAPRGEIYDPEYLDELCLAGEVSWGRLSPHPAFEREQEDGNAAACAPRASRRSPSSCATTPVGCWPRRSLRPRIRSRIRREELLAVLETRGASFFADLTRATGRLASEVEDGLWELVAAGLVTADGFENLRALLDPKRRARRRQSRTARPRHAPGRWALLRHTEAAPDGNAGAFARQLLARWGVVFRDAAAREPLAPAWRDLLVELRRMESRGEIRGGRFVSSFIGEQFALPEALDLLARNPKDRRNGKRARHAGALGGDATATGSRAG